MTEQPFSQDTYQVRLDWGRGGLARLAVADIVAVVDVLGLSARAIREVEDGKTVPLDHADFRGGAAVAKAAYEAGATVLSAGLRNASAVGAWILDEQIRRDRRLSVAIIACGAHGDRDNGQVRFAVEDHLGAGAVVDALIARGIDHTSPEAMVAAESFTSLRSSLRHLVSASGSARALRADAVRYPDANDHIATAARLDHSNAVPIVRNGRFEASGPA